MQPLTRSVHLLSEQIAQASDAYPNSIALSCGERNLTYKDFDLAADGFAAHLSRLGTIAGSTVVICMERSFDWVIAALGAMRAGAGYVPLDPAWPDSRLRFAINDSGPAVVVARTQLLDRLQLGIPCVDPARDAADIASAPNATCKPILPESLAYLIYTSGSTGTPKGVEITHANLAHLIGWHLETFKVSPGDRASHLAGLGFDASAWEIWPNLAVGATVCFADDNTRSSPNLIRKWMIRERISIGFVPTVHATPMLAMEWPDTTSLRVLLTGGDALPHGPATQLPFDVVNNYGPTECTVVATSSVLKPGSSGPPPIGLPIAGTTIYLLDQNGQQVDDGDTGEIFIGGAGVARGYRNLPDLTEKAFLPDPFSGALGARMYRTGDRGISRKDGLFEFRGRLDRQTKIRGQRMELDEIGSILNQHPAIEVAVAIVTVSQEAENQLVAYLVPKEAERVPTTHELQEHLLRSLPAYMVPSIFVPLRSFPISSNGKIDFALFPQPGKVELLAEKEENAPASATEEKLLRVVRELLENDAISAKDSFFLAGGHSLLGMQLVMRLRKTFGVDITLRQLFESPTVEQLAVLIESMRDASVDNARRNSIFWVQSRVVNLANVFPPDQPLYCVSLAEEDFAPLGEQPTFQTIAECLVQKIRVTQLKGPYRIGGLCLGGILAYEVASQLRAAGQEVTLLVLLDAPNPSFACPCDSWNLKLSYLQYLVRRGLQLQLRNSLKYAGERLRDLAHVREIRNARTKYKSPHQLTEIAARKYQPPKYDGEVLLLLATEHPPHVNLASGWEAVVTGNLQVQYVESHHRDLLKTENVQRIADAIVSHIASATHDGPVPCCNSTLGKRVDANQNLTTA
jgi:amino acid adenylation domain-containing protein